MLLFFACKTDGPGDKGGEADSTVGVTAVSLDITSDTIVIGRSLQLAATVLPADATNPEVGWTSSDSSVASVSAGGLVTALAEGSAVITASAGGGSVKADCSVVVRPLQWWTETLMGVDGGTTSQFPEIALNSNGDGLAVWTQYDGESETNVYTRFFDLQSGWGEVITVDESTAPASNPYAAVNENRDAVIVWTQSDGTNVSVFTKIYSGTSGWGAAELIETDNSGNAGIPEAGIDSNGNVLVTWYQHDGTRHNIWSNYYSVDTGWGTADTIETINLGNAQDCHVCIDDSGDGLAVWQQYNGSRWDIYGNRFEKDSGWSGAGLVESRNFGDATMPRLAMNGRGSATAVWMQYDDTKRNIYANRFEPSTGWDTAELIEEDPGAPAWPGVGLCSDGTAIAVWPGDVIDGCNIYYNVFSPGVGWGTYDLIRTDETGTARYFPKVAFDGSGNAVAVWHQQWESSTSFRAFAVRYEAGKGWDGGGFIEESTNNTDNISIAVDGAGNAIAIWEDKVDYRIFSNRLE